MLTSAAVASMLHQSAICSTTSTFTLLVALAIAPTSTSIPSSPWTLDTATCTHAALALLSRANIRGTYSIPRKLVEKLQSQQIVDTKNYVLTTFLFSNNSRQHVAIQAVGAACPCLQEVTSITTWCYGFPGYLVVLTTDAITRDQLVYARSSVMVDRPGWTTTEPSIHRQWLTQQLLGIPSILAC